MHGEIKLKAFSCRSIRRNCRPIGQRNLRVQGSIFDQPIACDVVDLNKTSLVFSKSITDGRRRTVGEDLTVANSRRQRVKIARFVSPTVTSHRRDSPKCAPPPYSHLEGERVETPFPLLKCLRTLCRRHCEPFPAKIH